MTLRQQIAQFAVCPQKSQIKPSIQHQA